MIKHSNVSDLPLSSTGKFKLPELQRSSLKFADVGGNEDKLAVS